MIHIYNPWSTAVPFLGTKDASFEWFVPSTGLNVYNRYRSTTPDFVTGWFRLTAPDSVRVQCLRRFWEIDP